MIRLELERFAARGFGVREPTGGVKLFGRLQVLKGQLLVGQSDWILPVTSVAI